MNSCSLREMTFYVAFTHSLFILHVINFPYNIIVHNEKGGSCSSVRRKHFLMDTRIRAEEDRKINPEIDGTLADLLLYFHLFRSIFAAQREYTLRLFNVTYAKTAYSLHLRSLWPINYSELIHSIVRGSSKFNLDVNIIIQTFNVIFWDISSESSV